LNPFSELNMSTLVNEAIPEVCTSELIIPSLSIGRTFWEKVTLMHSLNQKGRPEKVGARLSRHLYDIHCIYEAYPECVADLSLLADVVRHKERYFFDKKANYDAAKPGTLTLVPEGEIRDNLGRDYSDMGSMFYGDAQPLFGEIIGSLTAIQILLNSTLPEILKTLRWAESGWYLQAIVEMEGVTVRSSLERSEAVALNQLYSKILKQLG